MSTVPPPVPALGAFRAPIVDKNGMPSADFLKVLLRWSSQLTGSINQLGQIIGTITGQIAASATIQGRTEGIGTTVGHIDAGGVLLGPGVDLSRPYANKTTDHIADGTGSPLAGGAAAHAALLASGPAAGQALVFNGTDWVPGANQPLDSVAVPHQWIDGFLAATGIFTRSQPLFSDIGGAASASQLPASVPVISFGAGAPAGASTQGYIYFDTSASPYHGYVYNAGAWQQFS